MDGSKYSHYCWEWDGMLIDEGCDEFACCTCYNTEEFRTLRSKKQNQIELINAELEENL